jgi:DNA-binding CsgD family transcriptional regulator
MQLPISAIEICQRTKWVAKLDDEQLRVARKIADGRTNDEIMAELNLPRDRLASLISRVFQILRVSALSVTQQERRLIASEIYRKAMGR